MKVLLATTNKHKITKWGNIITSLGYELVTLSDLDKTYEEPKEDGLTAIDNAIKKAKFYYEKTGLVTFATDTAIDIEGLNENEQIGLFAGRAVIKDSNNNIISEQKLTDQENYDRYEKIINKLGGKASALYKEALIIYYGNGKYKSISTEVTKDLKTPPSPIIKRNAPLGSFTYYPELNKFRSEINDEEAHVLDADDYKKKYDFIEEKLYEIANPTQANFNKLPKKIERISDQDFSKELGSIVKPCICVGTGGSSPASLFASKILSESNNIISLSESPRDFISRTNYKCFDYILGITYSNRNEGVTRALEIARLKGLKTYLLTNGVSVNNKDIVMKYNDEMETEKSFISIASTIEPMIVMLNYYLGFSNKNIKRLFNEIYQSALNVNCCQFTPTNIIEIMSGDNTTVASRELETTLVESGLAAPIIHEKYEYCHGRSNLAYHNKDNSLIYLINGDYTQLDNEILAKASHLYNQIIILKSNYKDKIIGEFDLTIQSMLLCFEIAKQNNQELSEVKYDKQAIKLYNYKGNM